MHLHPTWLTPSADPEQLPNEFLILISSYMHLHSTWISSSEHPEQHGALLTASLWGSMPHHRERTSAMHVLRVVAQEARESTGDAAQGMQAVAQGVHDHIPMKLIEAALLYMHLEIVAELPMTLPLWTYHCHQHSMWHLCSPESCNQQGPRRAPVPEAAYP